MAAGESYRVKCALHSRRERAVENQTAIRRELRNTGRLALWTFLWVATLALAMFGPNNLWNSVAGNWIALAINLLVGAGWIIAHAAFLRGVDDLQRKIMLDAIALALGVGLVGGCAYATASTVGLISFEANIGFLSILMALVYIVAVAVGNLRYR